MHQYHIVSEKKNIIRRENRSSFIHTTWGAEKGNYTISVLMLSYNNVDQFFAALDRLEQEPKRDEFMITIVQNSDQEEAKEIFDKRIKRYNNITVIYPIENLGSAGGYAIGQEYILHAGYEHIVILEDDVELYENDTVSHTIASISNDKEVLFIQPPVNADGQHSWYVQFACYPTSLLEHAGVIDPRYFFRAEDLEWGKRMEDAIKHYHYEKKIIHRKYYHPYLKGVNNSGSWIYFSIRNQLWSYRKHHEGLLHIMGALMQYHAFAFLVFLRTGKKVIWECVSHGLVDGLDRYKPLEYHSTVIDLLQTYRRLRIEDLGFSVHPLDMDTLQRGANVKHRIAATTVATPDRRHLSAFEGDTVVIGGFQPVWGTFIACMKKLFVIEQMNRDKQELQGKLIIQGNASRTVNLLLFLPCALLGGIVALCIGGRLVILTYLRNK